MELKIASQTEEPLLNRKQLEVRLIFKQQTPKKEEVKSEIAKLTKAKEETISISKMRQYYGKKELKITVNIYNSEKELHKIETIKNKKFKKTLEETRKKEHEIKKQAKQTQNGKGQEETKE